MPKTARDYDTKSRTKRLGNNPDTGLPNFPVRDKPYNRQAGAKRLGYIRRAGRDGTWLVIESVPGTKRTKERVIGLADDYSRANGVDVLTFEQAMEKAAVAGELPPSARAALTVEQAVKDYYDRMGKNPVEKDNAKQYLGQLNKYMTEELNRTRVDKLTKTQLENWFADLLATPSLPAKSTCNRVLGQLKAPLYSAYEDRTNHIPSAAAWELCKPYDLDEEEQTRELDLDFDQVAKLIKAAASFDRDIATLIEAAFLTGARAPGELAALNVAHFDATRGRLQIQGRAPGVRSKTGSRTVRLDAVSVAFFAECAKDKLPNAPLLTKDGGRWPLKGIHDPLVKKAARLAGLPSDAGGVCLYTLRHSHISRAVESGIDYKVLALNCGTSVKMIVKHYAHLRDEFQNEQIQKHGPGAKLHAAA